MMSRHFALNSELTGAIAKRLPHAKNPISLLNIRPLIKCTMDEVEDRNLNKNINIYLISLQAI